MKRNFSNYYILCKIEIACNNKLFGSERASSRLEHVHHSFLYSFAQKRKEEEERKKKDFFLQSLPFHVQLISGRAFIALKAKRERERETSRYLVIDDRKERWHRADTRKSLVPRALSLECTRYARSARQLSRRPMFIPPRIFFIESTGNATFKSSLLLVLDIASKFVEPSRTPFRCISATDADKPNWSEKSNFPPPLTFS